ncbi:hypothetical protein D3C72_245300 [compost metagenome]
MSKVMVVFKSEEKEVSMEMNRDEVEILQAHKPQIDFDGDGWKIIDFRYDVDSGSFIFWIEKE